MTTDFYSSRFWKCIKAYKDVRVLEWVGPSIDDCLDGELTYLYKGNEIEREDLFELVDEETKMELLYFKEFFPISQ